VTEEAKRRQAACEPRPGPARVSSLRPCRLSKRQQPGCPPPPGFGRVWDWILGWL